MKISNTLTDEAILVELGTRITRRRLDLQLTQAAVAEKAGVAKRTLERVEAGETAQMSTIIRILRVLELLPALDHALPESKPRPLEWMRHKGKERKRASSPNREPVAPKPWTWGDEE